MIDEDNKINTHYLRISRQASIQISLKPIDSEEFSYLKKYHNTLTIKDFLSFFSFSESSTSSLIEGLNFDGDKRIDDFFNSEIFKQIKANEAFRKQYEAHRVKEREAFVVYINSFNVDIEDKGMFLVDIGWGGTMQESIYKFFNEKLKVTGFYLGLKEIYNITEDTKREGLIFSVLPYERYTDHILMANTQLYEQFSAADHGSALGYSKDAENYTRQFHEPNEKWLFENYINEHQEFSFAIHKELLNNLSAICYSNEMLQKQISSLALKVGIFQSTRKLKFLDELSKGFYQNIGDNKVGISYTPPKVDNRLKLFLGFLMTPEKYFRYLVKLKPMLYNRNKLLAFLTPTYLIYLYFKFNKYLRFNILRRNFLLKYNTFK